MLESSVSAIVFASLEKAYVHGLPIVVGDEL